MATSDSGYAVLREGMKVKNKKTPLVLVCIITGTTSLFDRKQDIRDKESPANVRQPMDSYQYGQAWLVADQLLSRDSFNIAYQYDYQLREPFQALSYYNEFLKNPRNLKKQRSIYLNGVLTMSMH